MKKYTSTQTIKTQIPEYIEGIFNSKGILPTKRMIYEMMKIKQDIFPYLFGKSTWKSTFGSTRSVLSEVCKNLEKRDLQNVYSFCIAGIDYFYTNMEQVYYLAAKNNSEENEIVNCEKVRNHCNIQFQLCGIFEKLNLNFWVPNNDSSGEKQKTKYSNKTILDIYGKNIISLKKNNEFYYIDFVVFDENKKPILQIEVEETTNVGFGMERMSQTKFEFSDIKSFVVSNNKNYQKKTINYSNGTYKDLEAGFIFAKKIETLYNKSLKFEKNNQNFKNLVNKEFGLSL